MMTPLYDGQEGLQIRAAHPDLKLIILDINMPVVHGHEMLSRLRASDDWIPVILLTALDPRIHMIEGFNRGADDFITKPFDDSELLARVKRRLQTETNTLKRYLLCEPLRVDRFTRKVWIGAQEIHIPDREFSLLVVLMERANRISSLNQIKQLVWESDSYTDNVVKVAINRLRKLLDIHGKLIKTHNQLGYFFEGEVQQR
jgi:DNA-binding response OmpR family regulator